MDDDELERQRAHHRLPVRDALLWGAEQARELVELTASEESSDECIDRLMAAPYALTEFQAQHVLDMQFRRLTHAQVKAWQQEAADLRRGLTAS